MEDIRKQKTDIMTTLCITLIITMALFNIVFYSIGRGPGQSLMFLEGDCYAEFVHFIRLFYRQLFHGGSLFYSFEQGLGRPTAELYGGCAFSPFHLVYLFCDDLNMATFLVAELKLVAAALAFAMLLIYTTGASRPIVIACSLAYAFCGFTSNFFFIISFMDGLYMLPILALCLWSYVRSGRWRALALVYAYIFIVQAFLGYIIGIFSGVLFLLLVWYYIGNDRKRMLQRIIWFAISVILAFSLSAFATLPTFMEIRNMYAEDNSVFEGVGLKWWEVIQAGLLGQKMGLYNRLPAVYSGLLSLILFPVFLVNRKQSGRLRIAAGIACVFLLLCIVWDPVYLLMHGFDNPDSCSFRFSFFVPFMLLWIAAKEWADGEFEKKKALWIVSAILCVLLTVLIYCLKQRETVQKDPEISLLVMEMNVFFIVLYGGILWFRERLGRMEYALIAVVAVELFANMYFTLTPVQDDLFHSSAYYEKWSTEKKAALEQVQKAEQEDPWEFYRISDEMGPFSNDSALFGYHNLGYFSSLEYENVRSVMRNLGYATSVKVVVDYGGTPFTRMLFAQKYTMKNIIENGQERWQVVKNTKTLPIGYAVPEDLIQFTFPSYNAFENQNALASVLCGKEIVLWEKHNGQLHVTRDGVTVIPGEDSIYIRYDRTDGEAGTAVFSFQKEQDNPVAAYFSEWGNSVNDIESPVIYTDLDVGLLAYGSKLRMPHILPVGLDENGEGDVTILMREDTYPEMNFETANIAYYHAEECEKVYNELEPYGFQVSSFKDDEICGTITIPEEKKVLFTSIPYDCGWHVKVDGKEMKTIPLLEDAFLGVPMKSGTHEVIFTYHNKWVWIGIIISLSGMGALIGGGVYEKKQNRKKS